MAWAEGLLTVESKDNLLNTSVKSRWIQNMINAPSSLYKGCHINKGPSTTNTVETSAYERQLAKVEDNDELYDANDDDDTMLSSKFRRDSLLKASASIYLYCPITRSQAHGALSMQLSKCNEDNQHMSIQHFLYWVAYSRTLAGRSQITDNERLRCPLIGCRCFFPDINMLLEHVFACAHMSDG